MRFCLTISVLVCLTDCMSVSGVYFLMKRLIHCLFYLLTDWLTDWLPNWLTDWLTTQIPQMRLTEIYRAAATSSPDYAGMETKEAVSSIWSAIYSALLCSVLFWSDLYLHVNDCTYCWYISFPISFPPSVSVFLPSFCRYMRLWCSPPLYHSVSFSLSFSLSLSLTHSLTISIFLSLPFCLSLSLTLSHCLYHSPSLFLSSSSLRSGTTGAEWWTTQLSSSLSTNLKWLLRGTTRTSNVITADITSWLVRFLMSIYLFSPERVSICLCVCVCACMYFYLSMYVCISICLCVYVFLSVYVCMYFYLSMYVCISICLSVYVFLSVCVCMHVFLSISVCVFLSICLYWCISICLCVYACLSFNLCVWMYFYPSMRISTY